MPGKLTAAVAATTIASAILATAAHAEELGARSGQGATTSMFAKAAPGEANVYEISNQNFQGVSYTKLAENGAGVPVTFASGIGNHGIVQNHRCRPEGAIAPPQRGAVLCPAITMTQTTAIDIRAGDGNDSLIKSNLGGLPGGKFNSLRFFGEDGVDFAAASDGDDTLSGGNGADVLSGKGGDDFIVGDLDGGVPGDDSIFGGDGADRIAPGGGNNTINAGAGVDRVEYSNLKTGLNILVNAKNHAGVDVLVGTPQGDTITITSRFVRSIKTLSGDDKIGAGSRSQTINPGPGSDNVRADAGNDKVSSRDGTLDRIDCGKGTDKVFADTKDKVDKASCETIEIE